MPDETAPTSKDAAPTKASAPVVEAAPEVVDPVVVTVQTWVRDKIAGGPIGRHTESWNALQDALSDLIAAIKGG